MRADDRDRPTGLVVEARAHEAGDRRRGDGARRSPRRHADGVRRPGTWRSTPPLASASRRCTALGAMRLLRWRRHSLAPWRRSPGRPRPRAEPSRTSVSVVHDRPEIVVLGRGPRHACRRRCRRAPIAVCSTSRSCMRADRAAVARHAGPAARRPRRRVVAPRRVGGRGRPSRRRQPRRTRARRSRRCRRRGGLAAQRPERRRRSARWRRAGASLRVAVAGTRRRRRSRDRWHASPVPVGVLVLGRYELMVAEHCALQAAGECTDELRGLCAVARRRWTLRDQKGYEFPVTTDAAGRTHILQLGPAGPDARAAASWSRTGIDALRLEFRMETPLEAAEADVRRSRGGSKTRSRAARPANARCSAGDLGSLLPRSAGSGLLDDDVARVEETWPVSSVTQRMTS